MTFRLGEVKQITNNWCGGIVAAVTRQTSPPKKADILKAALLSCFTWKIPNNEHTVIFSQLFFIYLVYNILSRYMAIKQAQYTLWTTSNDTAQK